MRKKKISYSDTEGSIFTEVKALKKVYAVYRAGYTDYSGLDTWRVMPNRNIEIDTLDPFLFLNHHGPQVFKPFNEGLPFGPHPHKGFETVTFIVEGDLVHKDSTGFSSNIRAGGIQWMTAGSGIIHSELSSDEFREFGGPIEILQLWINLPSHLKNSPPNYIGLQKSDIPIIQENELVRVHLIAGKWSDEVAPIQSLSHVQMCTIDVYQGGKLSVSVPEEKTILFYVIRGKIRVNGSEAEKNDLVEFEKSGEAIEVEASEDALLIFGYASPTNEPVVAHGPFVMNSEEEIRQAYVDYHAGRFGVWPH